MSASTNLSVAIGANGVLARASTDLSNMILRRQWQKLGENPGDARATKRIADEVRRQTDLKHLDYKQAAVSIGPNGVMQLPVPQHAKGKANSATQRPNASITPKASGATDRIDYRAEGRGHWITIGAKDGAGRIRVLVEGGRITKGHPSLTGKRRGLSTLPRGERQAKKPLDAKSKVYWHYRAIIERAMRGV